MAFNLVRWLLDIIPYLGNCSDVLSWVILSPISQLSVNGSWRNVEPNVFSFSPIRSPSPIFIASVWNQSHHLFSIWNEQRWNLQETFWEYLLIQLGGSQRQKPVISVVSLRQVQGMFSIATFKEGSHENEANLFSLFVSLTSLWWKG